MIFIPLGSFQTFLLAVVNVLMQVGQLNPDILYCLAYMQGEITLEVLEVLKLLFSEDF